MHSLVSIIRIVLAGKENWIEWFRKIMHTLIFNEFWVGMCDGDNQPTKLTDAKELTVWNMKNSKAYALTASLVSEEVNHHIRSIDDAWNALKKLKDLFESHSKLELVQLQLKLFNLKLKNDDPMALISEIRAIMHDIDSTGVKIDITLIALIKALYLIFKLS